MTIDLSTAEWRTSSYSGGAGGNCVEVAANLPGFVAIRDSKDQAGPVLLLTRAQWQAFTARVQNPEPGWPHRAGLD